MIGTILGQVTGQLEKRFILNAFFPTLVFVLALGIALTIPAGGPVGAVEGWEGESSATKALTAIAAVGAVFLLANLLGNGMQWVISFFEGYAKPVSFLAPLGRNHQLGRAQKLLAKAASNEAAADRFQVTFPVYPTTLTSKYVAPTRLGNILLSAETYSMNRYGVSAVRAWPRLSPLLPETILGAMAAARSSMEFLLAVSLLSGSFALVSSVYLALESESLGWIALCLLAGSSIAIATYLAALGPASIYGEQIRTAFDLHRMDLLRRAGMPVPVTPEEERRTWGALIRFLDRGEVDANWRYVLHADDS